MRKRVLAVLLTAAMAVSALAGCGSKSADTVSYTHLDVYKRQTQICFLSGTAATTGTGEAGWKSFPMG